MGVRSKLLEKYYLSLRGFPRFHFFSSPYRANILIPTSNLCIICTNSRVLVLKMLAYPSISDPLSQLMNHIFLKQEFLPREFTKLFVSCTYTFKIPGQHLLIFCIKTLNGSLKELAKLLPHGLPLLFFWKAQAK